MELYVAFPHLASEWLNSHQRCKHLLLVGQFPDKKGSVEHDCSYTCYTYDRTAQFIQDQVWLSPFNTLTRTYFHLYKLGSPPSITKDLGKSTSQPRSHDLANTHYIHKVAVKIIFTMSSQLIIQVWVLKPISENNIAFN